MTRTATRALLLLATALTATAQIQQLKPGFNLFSPEQDVQLGKETAAQVIKEKTVIQNPQIEAYLTKIGALLGKSPSAGKWQYEFHLVNDPSVNAFALPGGPVFVHTGLIAFCDNEAELAGVLAHEMSHVALRHSTNQASKANLIQLPALLAGAMAGGSMMGQLAKAGIGLGANSVLLKFSRGAESQADYNGAQMMAEAGWDPRQMAQLFAKLEGANAATQTAQILSDHPNPGNRVKAVADEVRLLPAKQYSNEITGQFAAMKALSARVTPPAPAKTAAPPSAPAAAPAVPPASTTPADGQMKDFRGASFTLRHPATWQVLGDPRAANITIAPSDGVVNSGVGLGLEVSFYQPQGAQREIRKDTQALVDSLMQGNPSMRVDARAVARQVGGASGLFTTFSNASPFRGETEVDWLVTVERPQGLFYVVLIAPRSQLNQVRPVFEQIINSVRF